MLCTPMHTIARRILYLTSWAACGVEVVLKSATPAPTARMAPSEKSSVQSLVRRLSKLFIFFYFFLDF